MITITMNDDFSLTADGNIIPAQYSGNIPFKFEPGDGYKDYIIVPGYISWNGNEKIVAPITDYIGGMFTVPAIPFAHDGMLGIAFTLTKDGAETITTEVVEFEVRESIDLGIDIPKSDVWQQMLINFVDQYMDKVYSQVMTNLISRTDILQNDAIELQKVVNQLIKTVNDLVADVNQKLDDGDFTLDFKWEGTKLFIKKHTDVEFGAGIDLAGVTTTYLDDAVMNTLTFKTERTDVAQDNTVHVQLVGTDGKVIYVEVYKSCVYGINNKTLEDYITAVNAFTNAVAFFDQNSDPVTLLKNLEF